MQPSIFTKIVNGDIPCHKVYEDADVLAFMDLNPVQSGHVLVIPKRQIEFVWDLPKPLYERLMLVTQQLALHIREVMQVPYVHSRIVGTDVPHAHIHLIPFTKSTDLAYTPPKDAQPDHTALAELAKKLAV